MIKKILCCFAVATSLTAHSQSEVTEPKVLVYPNPSYKQNGIKIKFDGFEEYTIFQIRVIDVSGKTVYYNDTQKNNFTIEPNSIKASGNYLLQVLDSENNYITIKRIHLI